MEQRLSGSSELSRHETRETLVKNQRHVRAWPAPAHRPVKVETGEACGGGGSSLADWQRLVLRSHHAVGLMKEKLRVLCGFVGSFSGNSFSDKSLIWAVKKHSLCDRSQHGWCACYCYWQISSPHSVFTVELIFSPYLPLTYTHTHMRLHEENTDNDLTAVIHRLSRPVSRLAASQLRRSGKKSQSLFI